MAAGLLLVAALVAGLLALRSGRQAGDQRDRAELEPIASLPGARGFINTLQLSDDGETLLATSRDQSVSMYDLPTGTRLGDPIRYNAPGIYGAFLRPDGKEIAITNHSGVAIWDLAPDHLQAAACQLAGRNLTPTEWDTYLANLGEPRPTCPGFA